MLSFFLVEETDKLNGHFCIDPLWCARAVVLSVSALSRILLRCLHNQMFLPTQSKKAANKTWAFYLESRHLISSCEVAGTKLDDFI